MSDEDLRKSQRSIRKHLIAGLVVVLVLAGGFGSWASTVQISGALIAPGQVVVDSNVKKVQHPTGGVVGEVRVRDGDIVKAGDIVVRLDETVVRASLAIVVKTLNGLWARAARLEAEQRGAEKITFPPMLTDRASDPDVRDRDRKRDQAVRGSRLRPGRPEVAIARAGRAAPRGNRRPHGAGTGEGKGNRPGREGAGRRTPAL